MKRNVFLIILSVFFATAYCAEDGPQRYREMIAAGNTRTNRQSMEKVNPSHAEQTKLREQAKQSLIQSIKVEIVNEQETKKYSVDGIASTNFQQNLLSRTSLLLKNLNTFEYINQGRYYVVAYISDADLAASAKDVATEVGEILKDAESIEQRMGMSAAINRYLDALDRTTYSSDPVAYQSDIEKRRVDDVKNWCEGKAKAFLKELEIISQPLIPDPEFDGQVIMPINVLWRGQPQEGILVGFMDSKQTQETVMGQAALLYDKVLPNELEQDDFVQVYLRSGSHIVEKKSIKVSLRSIAEIGFRIERNADNILLFKFKPEVKGITVKSLEWDLGDGNTTTEKAPLNQYRQEGAYTIVLTVNRLYKRSASLETSQPIVMVTPIKIANYSFTPALSSATGTTESIRTAYVVSPKAVPNSVIMLELAGMGDYASLCAGLAQRKSAGQLRYTENKAQSTPEMYLVVVSQQGSILAFLSPGPARVDLRTGERLASINARLKGQKVKMLWIEPIE